MPRRLAFLARGVVGFTILSLAGFAPWAAFGSWLSARVGEVGLYLTCAAVFLGLSGPLLSGLIVGPQPKRRVYLVFAPAFAAYAVLWIAGWFALKGVWHGHAGSLGGLLAGTLAMGWILAASFSVRNLGWQIVLILFALNTAGYFIGGWLEMATFTYAKTHGISAGLSRHAWGVIAKSLWGLCYGLGFGTGIGWAFYVCQRLNLEVGVGCLGLGWVGEVGASGFPLIGGFHEDGGEEAEVGRFVGE
ncbi:MAG: hypothetical protein NT050_12170 [Verrucomicrobia bacterium]|nr:hypothetical protein [Verrucomicrobiota bacterium]